RRVEGTDRVHGAAGEGHVAEVHRLTARPVETGREAPVLERDRRRVLGEARSPEGEAAAGEVAGEREGATGGRVDRTLRGERLAGLHDQAIGVVDREVVDDEVRRALHARRGDLDVAEIDVAALGPGRGRALEDDLARAARHGARAGGEVGADVEDAGADGERSAARA